jgi:hypothetical protein
MTKQRVSKGECVSSNVSRMWYSKSDTVGKSTLKTMCNKWTTDLFPWGNATLAEAGTLKFSDATVRSHRVDPTIMIICRQIVPIFKFCL